ncbi:unnamed protein product [Effrenium voratum]|uniref:Uncharacterized protein n=1 Tax=Effrenium voratum TaxID=2562239 RepID=A0AA36I0B1_9DINO|nr:unnamed protein product [Effrenium voratum]
MASRSRRPTEDFALNAVGVKLLASSASLPPTRGSASTTFTATRASNWSASTRGSDWTSALPTRCLTTALSISVTGNLGRSPDMDTTATVKRLDSTSPRDKMDKDTLRRARLPKLERLPVAQTSLEMVGASMRKSPSPERRMSRSAALLGMGEARPDSSPEQATQKIGCATAGAATMAAAFSDMATMDLRGLDIIRLEGDRPRPDSSEDRPPSASQTVPLNVWLQEMGVIQLPIGDLSNMLVQGRAAYNRHATDPLPMSVAKRARLDRAFVEHLGRIAQEQQLPLGDLTEDLQIWRLKLHDRQARRRLHDIFGGRRRRAPPPPNFAKVVAEEVPAPKVKDTPAPVEEELPRAPRAPRVRGGTAEVVPEEEVPVPVPVPVTPGIRKPNTPKKQEEEEPEVEKPETPKVQGKEEEEEEEDEIRKPVSRPVTRPEPGQPTPKAKEREAPKAEVVPAEPVEEKVPEPRGLFRVKELAAESTALLFPQPKPKKEKSKDPSRQVVQDADAAFQEDSENPLSSSLSRPASQARRRMFLAEQFREAIAAAWQKALEEVNARWSFSQVAAREAKEDFEDEETRSPDSDQDLEAFSSLFSGSDSQEGLSLAESAKRLQRRRYRRRLLRRTGDRTREKTARCWTQRAEACRRLLANVDCLTKAANC